MQTIEFLRSVTLFMGLEDKSLEEVVGFLATCTYPRNKVIFFQSEVGDNFYIVKSGSVKVYRLTEEGREVILAIFKSGDFFGEMAILDGEHRSATVETREPTVLLSMNSQALLDLVRQKPEIALNIISILSKRLRQANARVEDFSFHDARTRIINSILKIGKGSGNIIKEKEQLLLNITHNELASLAGTTRETVSRVLMEMQEEGLIKLDRKLLIIPNPEILETKVM